MFVVQVILFYQKICYKYALFLRLACLVRGGQGKMCACKRLKAVNAHGKLQSYSETVAEHELRLKVTKVGK